MPPASKSSHHPAPAAVTATGAGAGTAQPIAALNQQFLCQHQQPQPSQQQQQQIQHQQLLEPAAYASVPVLPVKQLSNGFGSYHNNSHQPQHPHTQSQLQLQQQQQQLHNQNHQNPQMPNKRKFSTFF
ncbi:uncharacterized protein DMAD_00596 [Drosophila madeirensis]|uniref:Uncharacterized protein n=1 Tax=Drosophila madeirensis TaxID=30013 RepID=A0AAU9FYH3_DROMD